MIKIIIFSILATIMIVIARPWIRDIIIGIIFAGIVWIDYGDRYGLEQDRLNNTIAYVTKDLYDRAAKGEELSRREKKFVNKGYLNYMMKVFRVWSIE